MKLGEVIRAIDNSIDDVIKENKLRESPNSCFKVRLCVTDSEKTAITTNVDNPLLVPLYDLEVYGLAPEEEYTLEVWITEESVLKLLKGEKL